MADYPELVIEKSVLQKGLERIDRVIERRNTIPILANVLIRGEGDLLTVVSTDLDIEVTATMPALISKAGVITLPGDLLTQMVRKMPDGSQIKLIGTKGAEGQSMTMLAGRSKALFNALPASDFPHLQEDETLFSHRFVMKAAEIKAMINAVSFAISTEETRYYLNGIYFHIVGHDLVAVATDGHRLSRFAMPAPAGSDYAAFGIIIPRKTVTTISALLKTSDEDVQIDLSTTKIRFSTPSFKMVSKLIDGTFPDYDRVVPKGANQIAFVKRGPLAAAIDRVSTMSSERGRAVKFSFSTGRLDLTVTSPDHGAAEDNIDADYDSDPLDIGFNAQYMKETLATLVGEDIELKLTDAGSPMLVHAKDDAARHFVVVMPMRV